MKQKYVIDLRMRYIGDFENEDRARWAAAGWAMDHVPDQVEMSCLSSSVRKIDLHAEDSESDTMARRRLPDAILRCKDAIASDPITPAE